MSASKYTLQCNSHKCRAKLSGFAWVTACSHVFCDHHGSEAFSRAPSICPVCSTMLSGKLDVFRTELVPSEQYKAMVLVGLQPETVLEISHNALLFWTYQVWCLHGCNPTYRNRRGWDWTSILITIICGYLQVNQERLLMEYNLSRTGGQMLQMEKFMTQQNQSRELELNALRGEIASLKKVSNMIMPSNQCQFHSLFIYSTSQKNSLPQFWIIEMLSKLWSDEIATKNVNHIKHIYGSSKKKMKKKVTH